MPAPPRQSRAQLLEATRVVVLRLGLSATMDQIAEGCGVTRVTLYRHFGNREGLIGELLLLDANRLATEVDELLADRTHPFPERLVAVVTFTLPAARRSLFVRTYVDESSVAQVNNPEVDERLGQPLRHFFTPHFAHPAHARLLRHDPITTVDWFLRACLVQLLSSIGDDAHAIRRDLDHFVLPAILTPNALRAYERRRDDRGHESNLTDSDLTDSDLTDSDLTDRVARR